MNLLSPIRMPVFALKPGDMTSATGETIISVSAGIRTPKGKMDVVLERDNHQRRATWNRHTMIGIIRVQQ